MQTQTITLTTIEAKLAGTPHDDYHRELITTIRELAQELAERDALTDATARMINDLADLADGYSDQMDMAYDQGKADEFQAVKDADEWLYLGDLSPEERKRLENAEEIITRGQRIIDRLTEDGQELRRENSDLRRQLHQLHQLQE